MLNTDFLTLCFPCLEAMEPISPMFVAYTIINTLKVTEIVSRPSMPLKSS